MSSSLKHLHFLRPLHLTSREEMDKNKLTNYITHHKDVCLRYCAVTHAILRDEKYLLNLTFVTINVNTI